MRDFSGNQQFDALKEAVASSYKKVFPISKDGYTLDVNKVWVDDKAMDVNDFPAQKSTRLAGGTWGAPLYAEMVLKDSTGKVIDTLKQQRLATIPRLTPRGSYIVNGNEYQVNNQLIRKPGVYVQKKTTGDQFKANFKFRGENVRDFEMDFNPLTNKYAIKKIGGHTVTIPLYPFLKSLGVSDESLEHDWGKQVLDVNRTATKPSDYQKLADRLSNSKTDSQSAAMKAIQDFSKRAGLDAKVVGVTLGHESDHLDGRTLLSASQKLLHTYQGKAQPDDPESLLFKEVLSVEDMIKDKFERKHVRDLKYTLGRQLGKETQLKKIINVQRLSSPLEHFFTTDDRSSTPEQYNPVQMLSNLYKLTMTGTGGITDPHTVVPEVREVHPTHMGFIDPVHTPESSRIGTMLHLSTNTVKDGREVKTRVYNVHTGKVELKSPIELYQKTVAFPEDFTYEKGKFKFTKPEIKVQRGGKFMSVPTREVDYIIPNQASLFSYSTNLIPFLQNDQGTRVMMGSKMIEQAIPLVDREAPLVQTAAVGNKTFHQLIGEQQTVKAPVDGVITEIRDDHITIGKTKVPIYHNFPLNQKTFISHEPIVKVGQHVKAGQLIADNNFTKNGTLAIGKNLKVAYLAYPGLTFEDGIVITESASKKLSTQQVYRSSYDLRPGKNETNLRHFNSLQPGMISTHHKDFYDGDGVVKKGTVVQPGQITIMGLKYELDSLENSTLRKINKSLQQPWTAQPIRYAGEFPGVVTDVVKRGDKVEVFIKAVEPARESDKLSGVHGNKGVITRVIPDSEAPRTKDGKIPDVFLNPHGIIGRINLGQLYESAASKIAEKTGKPYIVHNFNGEKTNDKVTKELKDHGIDDMEEMFLPNGKSIGKVNLGKPYILRLAKTGKSGFSARMPGTGYDQNLQPIKGGEAGTKSMDPMTIYSMLSHGAKKNLIDAHQKSEMNDEYWRALETGRALPAPKPTFAFNKFMNLLRGAGINPQKVGSEITLSPMSDEEVKKLSNGKIAEYNFLLGKDLSPKKGGFFDTGITGGVLGQRFSHIELPEKMPNPVFESAILSLSNLNKKDYLSIINGTLHVDEKLNIQTKAGPKTVTGSGGIERLLSTIDLSKTLASTEASLKTAKPEELAKVNKKIRYLKALQELKTTPADAYMRKLLPVIPPVHRPVYEMPGRGLVVAPANYLYQNVGILGEAHKHPVMDLLHDEEKKDLRADTYKATAQLAGLEPVLTRGKDQPIEGFISQITSTSPKNGFFLQKVVTKKQDLVGRGVITAGPELSVDQIGIPEKMAWKVFHPFIVREYTLAGMTPTIAREEIEKQAPRAKQMLLAAMSKRTVLANRAPSLHKFSIMAFKPVLTSGLALKFPPLVLKGFGGDYDGDALQIHIPTSEQAVAESQKMFPSANLFKPGTRELMIMPSQESAIGLYQLSQTEAGRKKINSILPAYAHIDKTLDDKAARALYSRLSQNGPNNYAQVVMGLKNLGDKTAYENGFSVGLKDVRVDRTVRDRILKQADQEVATLKKGHKVGSELDEKVAAIYQKATEHAYQAMKPELAKNKNSFYEMVTSGARGKATQLMQLVTAPGILKDAKERSIPTPVRVSYAEGLAPSDYFTASYGVRKGMMDRALQTSLPGAASKDIMASVMNNIVTERDCGTARGVELPVGSKDLLHRVLAKDQAGVKRGTIINSQVAAQLQKAGAKSVLVRTPLECVAKKGTCAACFGLDEHGHLPEIGDNIGVKSGQAISEPLTQLQMKTFHTGGIASGGSIAGGFERIRQLISMPEYVAGEAALSSHDGKVTKITKSPAGGHEIFVGDTKHTTRPGMPLRVKVGDSVQAGDLLSDGVIKPQSLVKYKGMRAAQNYLVDELKKVYDDTLKDNPMERKTIETVVRSFGNMTRVVNSPKHSDFVPGDIVPFTVAEQYNEQRKITVPTAEAAGYHLSGKAGKLSAHHPVTDKDLPYLKSLGYNEIQVLKEPLRHAPILKGIERLPQERQDWMSQLGYRYIKNTLTEGASQGWKTHTEGEHPIPALAYGATFGQKKEKY